MFPRALRTLSVLSVLSAVSGAVLLSHSGPGRTGSATAGTVTPIGTTQLLAADTPAVTGLLGQTGAATRVEQQARRDSARTAALVAHRKAEQVRAAAQRAKAVKARAAAAAAEARAQARAKVARSAVRDPRAAARIMVADRGWGPGQFSCLDQLWRKESNWNPRAMNPSSGAHGIPQALPGGKMASAGADWRTNPVTQIRWGLGYIKARYATPCGAWAHSRAHNWY